MGSAAPPLCGLCVARLPRVPEPRCRRCGGLAPGARHRGACAACASWPPALAAAGAPYSFEGPAAEVVRALKYGGWRTIAPLMAERMGPPGRRVVEALEGDGPCAVVPVPLSAARRRERGFNQAEDLAGGVAAGLGLAVERALAREGGAGRQAGAGVGGRAANVQGRFRPVEHGGEPGRRALLVDDVLTTGATALACVDALAQAGFTHIGVLTFARTLRANRRPGHGSTR